MKLRRVKKTIFIGPYTFLTNSFLFIFKLMQHTEITLAWRKSQSRLLLMLVLVVKTIGASINIYSLHHITSHHSNTQLLGECAAFRLQIPLFLLSIWIKSLNFGPQFWWVVDIWKHKGCWVYRTNGGWNSQESISSFC